MKEINDSNKSSKKPSNKVFAIILCILLFCVCAVQCFAQVTSRSKSKNEVAKDDQYLAVIEQLYYYIQQNYVDEVDPQVLYEGALSGMLNALGDPHSSYLNEADWRSITDLSVGSFGGIGVSISKPNESTPDKPAYVEVVSPIDDGPGARAGIQAGDKILKIGDVDTSTITMEEVLKILRGEIGTAVTITIRRGKTMEFERTLVRAKIENPTIKFGMIGKTGYIRITEFGSTTAERFQEALDSCAEQGYDSLIIDLRNNGGGLLSAAVSIADKFIDSGTIVSTKSRIAYENSVFYASRRKTVVRDIPVIVLINGGSASASEILSGALKDAKIAYLVGERSYGKGSVQAPRELLNNDGFKITIAKYYSPSDVNIDKIGIPADLEVLNPELSEAESESYVEILENEVIEKYVEDHPGMTESDISAYAKQLSVKYGMEERLLRKLVRNEVDRTTVGSRLYDLDYDIQLNAALDLIKKGNFKELMKTTKTLKEIQEEEVK